MIIAIAKSSALDVEPYVCDILNAEISRLILAGHDPSELRFRVTDHLTARWASTLGFAYAIMPVATIDDAWAFVRGADHLIALWLNDCPQVRACLAAAVNFRPQVPCLVYAQYSADHVDALAAIAQANSRWRDRSHNTE